MIPMIHLYFLHVILIYNNKIKILSLLCPYYILGTVQKFLINAC